MPSISLLIGSRSSIISQWLCGVGGAEETSDKMLLQLAVFSCSCRLSKRRARNSWQSCCNNNQIVMFMCIPHLSINEMEQNNLNCLPKPLFSRVSIFLVYLMTFLNCLSYITSKWKMTVNVKAGRMWREPVTVYYKVLSQHLSGGTKNLNWDSHHVKQERSEHEVKC